MSSSGTHHGSGQPAGLQPTGEPSPPDVLPWASEFSSGLAPTAQQLPGSQVSLITLFLETFSFPASLASLSQPPAGAPSPHLSLKCWCASGSILRTPLYVITLPPMALNSIFLLLTPTCVSLPQMSSCKPPAFLISPVGCLQSSQA